MLYYVITEYTFQNLRGMGSWQKENAGNGKIIIREKIMIKVLFICHGKTRDIRIKRCTLGQIAATAVMPDYHLTTIDGSKNRE